MRGSGALGGGLVAASARDLLPLSRAAGALDVLMLAVAVIGAAMAAQARPAVRTAESQPDTEAVR